MKERIAHGFARHDGQQLDDAEFGRVDGRNRAVPGPPGSGERNESGRSESAPYSGSATGPLQNSCTRVTRANGLESGLTAMTTLRCPTRDQSSELYKPGAA